MKSFKPIIFIIPLFLNSCSLLWSKGKDSRISSKNYTINLPQSWEIIKTSEDVDFSFYNNTSKEIVYTLSYCHKFQNDSLKALANKSLLGLQVIDSKWHKQTRFSNRAAYEQLSTLKVDGLVKYVYQINFHKDHCYYEFQIISNSESIQSTKKLILDNTIL